MEKQDVKEGILLLLEGTSPDSADGFGWTFNEIKEYLKLNDIEYEENALKILLDEMENEGLIEGRLSGNTIWDYSIENPGIEIIKEKGKSLNEKWKLLEDNKF